MRGGDKQLSSIVDLWVEGIHRGIKPSLPGYLRSSTENLLSWIQAQGLQL